VYAVNATQVDLLGIAASEEDNTQAALDAFWQSLSGNQIVPFIVSTSGSQSVVRLSLNCL